MPGAAALCACLAIVARPAPDLGRLHALAVAAIFAPLIAPFGEAEVVSGTDALAVGLPLAYRAERGSVTFLGTDGAGAVIRVGELPLVLHRVVFGR